MTHRVLVIETEAAVESPLSSIEDAGLPARFERAWWNTFAPDAWEASGHDLLVAVDVPQNGAFPIFVEWMRDHAEAIPVFGVLSQSAPESLLRSASQALDDFVLWPASRPEIECRLHRLLRIVAGGSAGLDARDADGADRGLAEEPSLRALVGESSSFRQAVSRIPRVAGTDASVLITGETGTGKELAARAIHELSRRRCKPFIPVDCSALPEQLFENEMFGHERGAFTDAHRSRQGLVALAQGGTLFLDEVDSLGLGVQAKLLRLLQEKTYRPLGSERFREADVRILAASNRDLDDAVRRQQLRCDLFFRLDVLRLHLPPLRERGADIALLASVFLKSLTPASGPRRHLSNSALRRLLTYPWPGNVRELWAVLQRAVVFAAGPQISASDLALPGVAPAAPDLERPFRDARADAVAAFERGYIDDLLRRHSGNVTRAAGEARTDRRSFGRLARKYGLRPPGPGRGAGQASAKGLFPPPSG